MYSTSAGAAYTAGAGAMYSTSAGASYTAGAGVTYSSTGAGAAYTAGAGAKKTPSGETTGAGAMYSTTGAGGSVWFGLFERPIKLDKKNLEPKWPRRLLWLLWLWLLWTRVDEGHSEYPQMPTIQLCNVWQNTWESRLLASPATPQPSMTKNSSSSRAEVRRPPGLNSSRGESEKWRKKRPKTASKPSMTESEAPPTVAEKCSNLSLRDQGDVQHCRCPARPPCQCTAEKSTTLSMYCNCGTSPVSALTDPCTCRWTTTCTSRTLPKSFTVESAVFCTACTVHTRLSGITGMSNTLAINGI